MTLQCCGLLTEQPKGLIIKTLRERALERQTRVVQTRVRTDLLGMDGESHLPKQTVDNLWTTFGVAFGQR